MLETYIANRIINMYVNITTDWNVPVMLTSYDFELKFTRLTDVCMLSENIYTNILYVVMYVCKQERSKYKIRKLNKQHKQSVRPKK